MELFITVLARFDAHIYFAFPIPHFSNPGPQFILFISQQVHIICHFQPVSLKLIPFLLQLFNLLLILFKLLLTLNVVQGLFVLYPSLRLVNLTDLFAHIININHLLP